MNNYPDNVLDRVRPFCFASDDGSCVEWPRSRTKAGYGQLSYRNCEGKAAIAYAHRAAFMIANGGIQDGMLVCHTCDNPACINPDHLFAGSHQDNAVDMVSKGRNFCPSTPGAFPNHWSKTEPLRGEKSGSAKLTEAQAVEVLSSSEKGAVLARRLGVTPAAISSIRKRRTWAHLNPECEPAQ